jgi:tetratricopeptide (TPR) repeat protein
MTAEIAGQRGQYNVALEGYLQAARRVKDSQIAERAAKIALYLKDTERTKEAVSLWLEQDPENLVARKIAALSAVRADDKDLAVQNLNYILAHDPAGFEATLMELVKVLGKEGKGNFLLEVFDELGDANPSVATIFFAKAFLAMHLKKNELAHINIEKALEIQPGWTKAQLLQVQLAVLDKNLDKAKEILLKALEKDPSSKQFNTMLAKLYIQTAEYEKAAEVYEKLVEHDPNNTEARFSLALVYLQLEEDDEARNLFEKLVEHPRWQAQASLYMGRIEAKQKHIDDALVWFDRITSGPLVLEAGISAVSLLMNEERYDEAEDRLIRLREKFPNQELRLVLLQAELFNKQKQFQKAFDLLTTALLEHPNQKDLLYTRALIAERLNMLDVVESDLKFILEKYPNDANALNALGYTLVDRTDRYDEAAVYLEKAIKIQPDEPVIQDSYGWLMYKLGKPEKALEYLTRAYEKFKGEEIVAHLIEVYWTLGEKQKAKDLFENAIEKSPDNEYLLEVYQRIPELK